MCFPLLTALCRSVSPSARKAWGPPWPQQGAPPPLGKGRGRRQWAGAGAGVTGTGAGSLGLHWLRPPPHQGSHHLPPTSVCPASSCCSRAFTASASNCPLLQPGMATPTEVPTKAQLHPEDPDCCGSSDQRRNFCMEQGAPREEPKRILGKFFERLL
nr:FXYD domain-containing ion transport regulator 7 isoform X12 [Camelus dromedarius]